MRHRPDAAMAANNWDASRVKAPRSLPLLSPPRCVPDLPRAFDGLLRQLQRRRGLGALAQLPGCHPTPSPEISHEKSWYLLRVVLHLIFLVVDGRLLGNRTLVGLGAAVTL